jgi:hypothetical protein
MDLIWKLKHKEERSRSKGHAVDQGFVQDQTHIALNPTPSLSALSHWLCFRFDGLMKEIL